MAGSSSSGVGGGSGHHSYGSRRRSGSSIVHFSVREQSCASLDFDDDSNKDR